MRNTIAWDTPSGRLGEALSCPTTKSCAWSGRWDRAQNVNDGFTKPVVPISHTPARFVISSLMASRRLLVRTKAQYCHWEAHTIPIHHDPQGRLLATSCGFQVFLERRLGNETMPGFHGFCSFYPFGAIRGILLLRPTAL